MDNEDSSWCEPGGHWQWQGGEGESVGCEGSVDTS